MATASNSEFHLTVPDEAQSIEVKLGSDVTVPCHLSPEISAVEMEIKWFKETDCVCLYEHREVKEGMNYEGRASLFTDELNRGNVSLQLKNFSVSDVGDYRCQVTSADKTEEITVRIDTRNASEDAAGAQSPSVYQCVIVAAALLAIPGLGLAATLASTTGAGVAAASTIGAGTTGFIYGAAAAAAAAVGGGLAGFMGANYLNKNVRHSEEETAQTLMTAQIRRVKSIEYIHPILGEEVFSPELESELRLVLLERSGCVKREVGNLILGRKRIQTGASPESQQSESRQGQVEGRQVTVVETPDWFCSGVFLEELRQDVELCLHLSAPGPHAFLLVIPVKETAGEEREMLAKMEEIFGERCWRNTMILFGVTDEEQEEKIEEFVQSGDQELQRLMEKCGNRFHCLNINETRKDSQVSQLLDKIDKMVAENTERFYSSEIYLESESHMREVDKKIMRESSEIYLESESHMREVDKKIMRESSERKVRENKQKME